MGNLAIVGPSNPGIVSKVESQRSVNWYLVKIERQGERSAWHLRGRPGLETFCTLPHTPIRGAHIHQDRYFVVANTWVYEVAEDAAAIEWGRIGTVHGKVTIAGLLDTVVIGDGARYYALDLTTGLVSTIADAPKGRFCVPFDLRILYQGENGQVFYSELNDPTNIPGLNFFTAESLPDDIQAIATTEGQVWLIGTESTEVWYDSGDVDNPFARIPGGVIYTGTNSPDTVLRLDNSIWMVGRDKEGVGVVWRSAGSQFTRISTSAVERFTSSATNLSAFSYQEEGHSFYVLNADQGSWAFDIKTQEWHERAWLNQDTGTQERQRAETHAFAYGKHLVTDYANAKVYRQGLDLHSDDGEEVRRTRVASHVETDGAALIIDELFLDFATGVGLDGAGQGVDPQVMLRVSRDGASFGNEMVTSLGRIGSFKTQARFHRLGIGRDWVFEISVSDPVLSVLINADMRSRRGRR